LNTTPAFAATDEFRSAINDWDQVMPSLEVAMPSLPTRTYSDPVHSILTGVIPVANALVRFVHASPFVDV
jgi:hypothetical protein